ncbi:uncharacterized protein EAF02_008980 [Botrytis sinoallii]|uniref:uncharacterized protein n=1 Tax=Botrytis sinoallii TaxID=1463999 RepID=UPI0019016732|nr:uncharacterized protein EAF02_008980 [Botrytis sinoallii]KAF7872909.1 hypothetical protein EAF02_008980 [Botrytis sinoallii]
MSIDGVRLPSYQLLNPSSNIHLVIDLLFHNSTNEPCPPHVQRLEGKTIVITGASSGIGRSTALEFARTSPKDLRLILTARRIDVLEEVKKDIEKECGDGVKVLAVKIGCLVNLRR